MTKHSAQSLPELSFRTSFPLSLFWHVIAKYGDVVPANPTAITAVGLKYKVQNSGARNPAITKLLRELAYRADGWAMFEHGFQSPTTSIEDPHNSRYSKYERIIRKCMELEEDSYRSTYKKEEKDLERYRDYLNERWQKYGRFVLTEYPKLANERWTRNNIDTYVVASCLNTGVFRSDYLILPIFRNFDQGFCILLHLIARYLVTEKVLNVLYQYTGPSQDLYLDAIYGLIVNQVLLRITKDWPDFKAPIEPSGGLEFKIFRSLLPYWREHLRLRNQTFDAFIKHRISKDFIATRSLVSVG